MCGISGIFRTAGAPVTQWLKGPLRPLVNEIVNSDAYAQSPLWDGKAAQAMVTKNGTNPPGDKAYETVWPTVQAHLLMERFQAVAPTL